MKSAAEIHRIRHLDNFIDQIKTTITLLKGIPYCKDATEFACNMPTDLLEIYQSFQTNFESFCQKLSENMALIKSDDDLVIVSGFTKEIYENLKTAINRLGLNDSARYEDYKKIITPHVELIKTLSKHIQQTLKEIHANYEQAKITLNDELKDKIIQLNRLSESFFDDIVFPVNNNSANRQVETVDKPNFFNYSDYESLISLDEVERKKFTSFINVGVNHTPETKLYSDQELDQIRYKGSDSLTGLPGDVALRVLDYLDPGSLISINQTCRFFSFAKNNRFWEDHILTLFSAQPKLEDGETYYSFYKRNSKLLYATQKLSRGYDKPEEVYDLLYRLASTGLDKLFKRLFICYRKAFSLDQNLRFYSKQNDHNRTLVHAAASSNNTIILQLLIARKVSLVHCAEGFMGGETGHGLWIKETGMSPIQDAASSGSYECLQMLISHGVSVNDANIAWGQTPLHYAAENGHLLCIKLLVQHGAKLGVRSHYSNETPYECAKKYNHEECATYLAEEMQKRNIAVPTNSCTIS